jgi:hypothetical protein
MFIMRLIALGFFVFPVLGHAAETNNDIRTKKEVLSHTSRITPEPFLKVVDGQLGAIRSNELSKAYNDYTSTAFRTNISFEEFKTLVAKYQALFNNQNFQFSSFYIDDDIATFGGELFSAKGEAISVEYDFVSENDQWKIEGIQIYKNELPQPSQL